MSDIYNSTAINEQLVERLILNLGDYAERSNKIINDINSLAADTKSYFECDAGNKFRSKCEQITSEKNTLNKNILSYTNDLVRLKAHYEKISSETAAILKSAESQVEGKRG